MTPRPPAPAQLLTRPWWKPAGPQTLGRLESPARCRRQAGPATPRAPTTRSTRDAGGRPGVRTRRGRPRGHVRPCDGHARHRAHDAYVAAPQRGHGHLREPEPEPLRGPVLLGLGLLAALLVLEVVPAAAQTVTISPTTAQSVQEGNSFSFTLTVADAGATHDGYLDFFLGSASLDDFDVYEQATAPTGSDTPITITEEAGFYFYQFFSAGSPPASPVTFWLLAKTDTVYLEPNETLTISGGLYLNVAPYSLITGSDVGSMAVTLTEAPLPDPTGKPTTPANLTATAGRGAVTLTWDPVDATSSNTNLLNDVQITKHQVRQTTDSDITDETWTDIPNSGSNGVNATTYTIGSLTDGMEYTFQVRAVNGCTTTAGCGESDPATAVMTTPDADALAQPSGLMTTAGNTEITLTWTDPGDASIAYYEYAQKVGSAAFGPWTEIPGSSATTTSHRFTELSNGTAYSYRIRALEMATEKGPLWPHEKGPPPVVESSWSLSWSLSWSSGRGRTERSDGRPRPDERYCRGTSCLSRDA